MLRGSVFCREWLIECHVFCVSIFPAHRIYKVYHSASKTARGYAICGLLKFFHEQRRDTEGPMLRKSSVGWSTHYIYEGAEQVVEGVRERADGGLE